MSSQAARTPLPPAIRALFLVRLINSMGNFVFPFLTMLLTMKLGYTKIEAGAFMSSAALVAGLAVLVGGKVADRFGRKRTIAVLQVGSALLFGTCAVLGLVPIVPWLIAVSYVMLQASWPIFNALVADIAPAESRKRAYSILYWGNNIGFSIGPIMAGYLFNAHASYMFIGNAVSLAVVSAILVLGVKPSRNAGLNESVAAGTGTSDEPRNDESAVEGSLLDILKERPILIAFAATNLLMNFVYMQHIFSLPVFLNDTLADKGPSTYGMVMTANGLTVVALTALVTSLLAKRLPGVNMAIAGLFYAAGFGLLYFCASPAAVIVSTVVWTIGEIISATNSQVFIAALSPSSHRGRVNAFVMFVTGWGATLSPVVSGAYAARFGSRSLWPATFLVALTSAALMLLIARKEGIRRDRFLGRRSA